ncbi:hypothetical protein D3C78_1270180 [compost metagenome]
MLLREAGKTRQAQSGLSGFFRLLMLQDNVISGIISEEVITASYIAKHTEQFNALKGVGVHTVAVSMTIDAESLLKPFTIRLSRNQET